MPGPASADVTGLLAAWRGGDATALDALVPLVYAELHRLAHRCMRGERQRHPLQTTALIHEAYLRLVDVRRTTWTDRRHFFAVAAQMMRRVLVEAARQRLAQKRGGGVEHESLDEALLPAPGADADVVALDEALDHLATFDTRKARVVELRYFAGLSVEETAAVLGVSEETVTRDWRMAKLCLQRDLSGSVDGGARRGGAP